MASIAGAVIGAPIAAVLIVFELTQSYQMGLAALLSVVIALLVSNAIYGHSYFDNQLLKRGIDLSFGRTGLVLMETQIFQFTSQNFITVSETSTVSQVLEKLIKQSQSDAYIVDSSNVLIGKLEMKELLSRVPSETALLYADREPISIKRDASLQQAIEVAATFVGETIPVVDRRNNQICGILTEGDIFSEYLRLQNEIIDLEKR
jgi:CIC family chloride channel protein